MVVATFADALIFETDGFVFRPLAVPSRGSAELAIWALVVPPGAVSVVHSMDREEVFVVHEGELAGTVAAVPFELHAGDALIVPAHTPLQLRNDSQDHAARATACTSAGMHGIVGGNSFAPPWAQ